MPKITLTEEKELIIQNVRTSHITLLLDVQCNRDCSAIQALKKKKAHFDDLRQKNRTDTNGGRKSRGLAARGDISNATTNRQHATATITSCYAVRRAEGGGRIASYILTGARRVFEVSVSACTVDTHTSSVSCAVGSGAVSS